MRSYRYDTQDASCSGWTQPYYIRSTIFLQHTRQHCPSPFLPVHTARQSAIVQQGCRGQCLQASILQGHLGTSLPSLYQLAEPREALAATIMPSLWATRMHMGVSRVQHQGGLHLSRPYRIMHATRPPAAPEASAPAEAGLTPWPPAAGIKVDKGLVPMPNSNGESWCQGLDGLAQRTAEYYKAGARFAKWRSVVSIPAGPSSMALQDCAYGLARYAAISQVRPHCLARRRACPHTAFLRGARRAAARPEGAEIGAGADEAAA